MDTFSRSSKANQKDLDLIFSLCDYAVKVANKKISGVIGWDEDNNNKVTCIDFNRIKGGKEFNTNESWYNKMLNEINLI